MPELLIELPLTFQSHQAMVYAHPDANGGWEVTTNVDGREIGSDHCGDWHRVERYRARMQRWLDAAEPTAFDRRVA